MIGGLMILGWGLAGMIAFWADRYCEDKIKHYQQLQWVSKNPMQYTLNIASWQLRRLYAQITIFCAFLGIIGGSFLGMKGI